MFPSQAPIVLFFNYQRRELLDTLCISYSNAAGRTNGNFFLFPKVLFLICDALTRNKRNSTFEAVFFAWL